MALAMQRTHRISFSQLMLHTMLLLTLCLCHCKRDAPIDKSTVIIDPKVTLDKHWWDDKMTDDITYFALDSQKILTSCRTELCIDSVLITTHQDRGGIFFHKLDGKFVYRLAPTGSGPLEFSEVNALVKYDNTHILINDPSKNTILKYDFVNRKMVAEYPTNTSIFYMYYYQNKLLYVTTNTGKGLVKMVENFDFKAPKDLITGTSITNMIVSPGPIVPLEENKIIINLGFIDTIYFLNMADGSFYKKYILGEKESNLTHLGINKVSSAIFDRKFKILEKVIVPFGAPALIKNYLIVPIIGYDEHETCMFINIETDESYFYNFKNNEGSKLDFVECRTFPIIFSNEDGYTYSILNELSDEKRDESPGWPFIKAYNKLIEDKVENPVIVRFKMRD